MTKTFKDYLKEAIVASNYHCKDCGCQMHNCKPECQCEHDSHDETGSWWVDKNGNGVHDMDEESAGNRELDKLSEGDDRIMFKGKEIDTDTIEYDMQDISDIIFELEIGVKYTDGTEVEDGDMDELQELPELVDWVYQDYMDGQADQADMYRDAQRHGDFESTELDRIKELAGASIDETYDDDDDFYEAYGEMWWNEDDDPIDEAEYQGRKVKLGKPMQGDVRKFKVYVKDPKTGNVKKVNFGHGGSSVKGKAMSIKKSNPARRRSFRARHNCDNPGPRTKARYWSCRKW
jgi:hypothetical protein